MENVIIINEIVVFEPKKNRLTPLVDYPAKGIALHAPVSACLLLLLQNNQQPVTKKCLLSEVWEKNGVIVSTNALYQSIALIRKGLRATGLEEEIIITLPKIGFKADAKVKLCPVNACMVCPSDEQEKPPSVIPTQNLITCSQIKRSNMPLHQGSLLILTGAITTLLSLFYWYLQPDSYYAHYAYRGCKREAAKILLQH